MRNRIVENNEAFSPDVLVADLVLQHVSYQDCIGDTIRRATTYHCTISLTLGIMTFVREICTCLTNFQASPLPAVLCIHGGSWKIGSKTDSNIVEVATTLAQHGIAAFSIDYQLVFDGGEFPTNVTDVKHAVLFLANERVSIISIELA